MLLRNYFLIITNFIQSPLYFARSTQAFFAKGSSSLSALPSSSPRLALVTGAFGGFHTNHPRTISLSHESIRYHGHVRDL
jgi:hypothetical protein